MIRLLALVALMGVTTGCRSQAQTSYVVTLRNASAQSRFTPPAEGFPRWSDIEGTSIWLRLGISEPSPGHMIGRFPEFVLTRLVDSEGNDLLGQGHFKLDRPRFPQDRVPFLMPRVGSEHGDQYRPDAVEVLGILETRWLPHGLGELAGEVRLTEVTRDLTREFLVSKGNVEEEIAPGLRVWVRSGSSGGTYGEVGYEHASPGGKNAAVLNRVEVQGAGRSELISFNQGGTTRTPGKGAARVALPAGSVVVFHAVLETELRTVPFRFEPVQFRMDPEGSGGVPLPALESAAEGYQMRLNSIAGSAEWSPSAVTTVTIKPLVQLRIGLRREDTERVFSREPRIALTELRDLEGRPLDFHATPENGCPGCGPTLAAARPKDARQFRSMSVQVRLDRLPRALSVVKGTVELDEVLEEAAFDVPLDRIGETQELARGVRVTVEEPARGAFRRVRVALEAGADPLNTPVLVSAWTFEANGNTREFVPIQPVAREGGEEVELGLTGMHASAASIRLRVATKRAHRSLPFEFNNLPLTGER